MQCNLQITKALEAKAEDEILKYLCSELATSDWTSVVRRCGKERDGAVGCARKTGDKKH